jgi:hypothetical protein
MIKMFLLFIFLTLAASIPIHYNYTGDPRDPRAISWCEIVILPSHLGFVIRNYNPRSWVNYTLDLPIGWIPEEIQITTSTNSTEKFSLAIVHDANTWIEAYTVRLQIAVSWATLNPKLYVGLIKPKKVGKIPNPLPDSGYYCYVTDVKYGPCANPRSDWNKTECRDHLKE